MRGYTVRSILCFPSSFFLCFLFWSFYPMIREEILILPIAQPQRPQHWNSHCRTHTYYGQLTAIQLAMTREIIPNNRHQRPAALALPSTISRPGRVAQSVGHLTRKSGVPGSIPGLATYFRFSFRFFKKGSCQLLAEVCARSTG